MKYCCRTHDYSDWHSIFQRTVNVTAAELAEIEANAANPGSIPVSSLTLKPRQTSERTTNSDKLLFVCVCFSLPRVPPEFKVAFLVLSSSLVALFVRHATEAHLQTSSSAKLRGFLSSLDVLGSSRCQFYRPFMRIFFLRRNVQTLITESGSFCFIRGHRLFVLFLINYLYFDRALELTCSPLSKHVQFDVFVKTESVYLSCFTFCFLDNTESTEQHHP